MSMVPCGEPPANGGLGEFVLTLMDEPAIKEFLQGHPFGDAQVGGLRDRFPGGYDKFHRLRSLPLPE
jgi:hypothetical protein